MTTCTHTCARALSNKPSRATPHAQDAGVWTGPSSRMYRDDCSPVTGLHGFYCLSLTGWVFSIFCTYTGFVLMIVCEWGRGGRAGGWGVRAWKSFAIHLGQAARWMIQGVCVGVWVCAGKRAECKLGHRRHRRIRHSNDSEANGVGVDACG